ncbi:putative transcriptional regulator [Kitasatospora sp. GP30]|uniref:BlaI/MecI/CopY family transcriptional regulator n=1 Tax=Kitasatospora sp. GP30 TaxID=3035084 RepID=UPI000CB42BA2|nr:BlaI/MecI/CopY family transcriptional regulator [Kitasatospora sp. GP30]MDH6140406.1 putative transcriptional regulator [Kitasatospora sp. GP30]
MGAQSRDQRRESGALEAEVMAVLWAGGAPMTAGQVHAALGGSALVYKTVLTVLGRLHAKGLVDRERVGRAHAYLPRRGPAEEVASEMNQALARGADRLAVLQRFVDGLDPDDERALRDLLDARD